MYSLSISNSISVGDNWIFSLFYCAAASAGTAHQTSVIDVAFQKSTNIPIDLTVHSKHQHDTHTVHHWIHCCPRSRHSNHHCHLYITTETKPAHRSDDKQHRAPEITESRNRGNRVMITYHNGYIGGEQRDYGQNGIPFQHSINLTLRIHPRCPLLHTHRSRHCQCTHIPRVTIHTLYIGQRRGSR